MRNLRQNCIVLKSCILNGVVVVQHRFAVTFSCGSKPVLVCVVHTDLRTLTVASAVHTSGSLPFSFYTILVALFLPVHIRARLLLDIILMRLVFLLLDLLNGKVGLFLLKLRLCVSPIFGGIDLILIKLIRLVDHTVIGLIQFSKRLSLVALYLCEPLVIIIYIVFYFVIRHLSHLFI